jgi:hypothetical protein
MKHLRDLTSHPLISPASLFAPRALTNEKASKLARSLANAKALELYRCQPFSDGAARFDNGLWVWREERGRGLLDYEATVELAADGSARRVDVVALSTVPVY